MSPQPHILIVGGGYVGMYTAHRLQKKLRPSEATVTVVDPQPNMTYQPFLAEAAAGSIEPRHVVVPLRRMLPRCEVVTGTVVGVHDADRVASVVRPDGETVQIQYDILVMAPGSVARPLPIPGLAESAMSFKTLGEAIHLRNHVLAQLDLTTGSTGTAADRRRRLTFVVAGGGYSGVEVIAELEDMTRHAIAAYPGLSPTDLRWLLVEASDRIMPEVSPSLAAYTTDHLRKRGIEVHLGTRIESMLDGRVVLTDGETFEAATIVWTAGVRANPLVARSGFHVDRTHRLVCDATLRAVHRGHVWGAGDSAAVPDLCHPNPSATCPPSAQHAVRQAKQLADNIVATLRDRAPQPYRHRNAGSVASLGLHQGVAEIYGIRLRGRPAWYMHRLYHVSRMPTTNRKVRVVADWALALLLGRDVVSLEQIHEPGAQWRSVMRALPMDTAAASKPADSGDVGDRMHARG